MDDVLVKFNEDHFEMAEKSGDENDQIPVVNHRNHLTPVRNHHTSHSDSPIRAIVDGLILSKGILNIFF